MWADASVTSETRIRVKLKKILLLQNPPLKFTVFHFVRPAPNFYFPTLHQLKFEIEDGVTPNSRPVRFGFSQREFPEFSWRGYAVMSPAQVRKEHLLITPDTLSLNNIILLNLKLPFSVYPLCDWLAFTSALIFLLKTRPQPTSWCGNVECLRNDAICLQPEVILTLPLGFPGPFHIVMRYSTPRQKGGARVTARILLVDEAAFQSCCNCKWRACIPLCLFHAVCWLTNPVRSATLIQH